MNIFELKKIMKEINAPNEYIMEPVDLNHSLYWIFRVQNLRLKTLDKRLVGKRAKDARFDVFLNGLYIRTSDYRYRQFENDFYIDFKRSQFPDTYTNPPFDGQPYEIEETDEVKINGDLERIN